MDHRAGYVNIIGRPNVGKSTLLNALLGDDLVIVNPKAQTTRHRILGILNEADFQLILSDTPGILEPAYKLQESMMHAVDEALGDADVLLVMVELGEVPEKSGELLRRARRFTGATLVLINKVDQGDEVRLNEAFELWQAAFPGAPILPISALHGLHIKELRSKLVNMLPVHPPYFPKDELSDRDLRFFISEIIREKVLGLYKQEIPYSTQVVVNSFEESPELVKVQADVIVMRESQKGIIIGRGGGALRQLGTEARKAMEKFLGNKVFLDLKVKVDEDWRGDDRKLRRYGY
ncbi:MAG: GTPase Era [Flavobacteriales bacterium]|nr:GTPase Era [Flavobacteriales bacterium]MBP9078962.1 GTPase Era [Flavobacteriales bacterium]